MSGEVKNEIYALWFDRAGCGPSAFRIEAMPMRDMGTVPAFGLMFKVPAGGFLVGDSSSIPGGGLMIGKDDATELHRAIGDWLASLEGKS